MQEAKPPLAVEEVERVLGLLAPLSESAQIVLGGGQALSERFAALVQFEDRVLSPTLLY